MSSLDLQSLIRRASEFDSGAFLIGVTSIIKQRRRQFFTFAALFAFFTIALIGFPKKNSFERVGAVDGVEEIAPHGGINGGQDFYGVTREGEEGRKQPWTRLLAGTDGFYVLENVYVRDRILYAVPHPSHPPLPALNKIITSRVHENYTSLPATSPEIMSLANSYLNNNEQRHFDYPDIPRLFVLSQSEAEELTNGVFGRMDKYARQDGTKWDEVASPWWWNRLWTSRKKNILVLEGMTFYFADDPAITGWGSLMHHYFHFLGELVLGTYHAYTSSVLDPLPPPPYLSTGHSESLSAPVPEWKRSFPQRRGVTDAENENDISIDAAKLNIDISSEEDITPYLVPPPSRFVSPFCVNWENRDLQEKIIEFGLGNPEVYRRERWTDMQRDRRWRMFDRVVITDRHAAHNDYWSQVSRWNKMPLDVLHQPLPPSPINFFLGPQLGLTSGLELPPVPSVRRESGKSLVDGEIKIVYVDRQGSDRKFTNESHDGLIDVLDKFQSSGVTVGTSKRIRVKVEIARFETMSSKEQIEAAYDADIFIGVHGNGLTHLAWARSGATVIEVFPVGSFIRDYEMLSTALDHEYIAVWDDAELTKAQWTATNGGVEPGRLHDGTQTLLDRTFIQNLLKKVITRMA